MEKRAKQLKWVKLILAGIVVVVGLGLGVKEYQTSQVLGHSQYRFNMALIVPDTGITFVSFDPSEKSILSLVFPTDMAISTRSSGEYSISSLYKLGSYRGQGGKFARQKIQGFMRVPIPGYVVANTHRKQVRSNLKSALLRVIIGRSETSLSKFDAIYLYYRANRYSLREVDEEELVRSAVIEKGEKGSLYHPERLQEYVGTRLFDWGIGATGVTVAIVNESGENGLGSDMADFLTNLGLDVVMVRSVTNNQLLENTEWQVGGDVNTSEIGYIFENLFGLDSPKMESVPEEYRAKVLIRVGKDAKELF